MKGWIFVLILISVFILMGITIYCIWCDYSLLSMMSSLLAMFLSIINLIIVQDDKQKRGKKLPGS